MTCLFAQRIFAIGDCGRAMKETLWDDERTPGGAGVRPTWSLERPAMRDKMVAMGVTWKKTYRWDYIHNGHKPKRSHPLPLKTVIDKQKL